MTRTIYQAHQESRSLAVILGRPFSLLTGPHIYLGGNLDCGGGHGNSQSILEICAHPLHSPPQLCILLKPITRKTHF